MNVLLVDDDDAVRLTIGALLEDDGHIVLEAATIAAARDRLGDAFELAIVDLHLPDGSGTTLIAELRARRPDVVVVLLTGADAERGEADFVVAKDRSPAEIIALAAPLVAARRGP